MTVPVWVTEQTDAFWARAGDPGPYPRDLRLPLLRAHVVALLEISHLHLSNVLDWLFRHDYPQPIVQEDRPLRAALVAMQEACAIFLERDDPPDERRLSLTHEVAHFLNDYWFPRRRSERLLGPRSLEILDGKRPPLPRERVRSILAGVTLAPHTHFLARQVDGRPEGVEAVAERNADRLAYELLAPAEVVLGDQPASLDVLELRLQRQFGLPREHAARYSRILVGGDRPHGRRGVGLLC